MDNQSAIKIIKNCTMLACEYHIKDKCNKDYAKREDDFEEAKKMAITAIEKQIPRKPSAYKGYGGKCKCGAVFLDRSTKYCGNCGQAIDWSES